MNIKANEEYDWNTYTNIYSNQIKTENDSDFIVKNARVENGKVNWNGESLHMNIVWIIDKILETNPKSVFECGFGGGHNIYSIGKLFPNIKMGGVELLESQVEFGRSYFNLPSSFYTDNNLSIGDWSIPGMYKDIEDKYDLVYTNAVIMHLNTEKAINFINNIIGMEPKYITLAEGYPNHDWEQLFNITRIREKYEMLNTPTHHYFYFKRL